MSNLSESQVMKMWTSVGMLVLLISCSVTSSPTSLPEEGGGQGVISLGKLFAGGGGGGGSRPTHTMWDLLVEKAEGYMHSMLFCTLSRPDVSWQKIAQSYLDFDFPSKRSVLSQEECVIIIVL